MKEHPMASDEICTECDAPAVVSIRYHGECWAYCRLHRDEALTAWQNSQEAQAEQNSSSYYGGTSWTVAERAQAALAAKREGR